MEKKNLFVLLLTTILCTFFLISSALADSRHRHKWRGVAIGIGVTMPGSAFYFGNRHFSHHRPHSYVPRYAYPKHRRHLRHWKVRKKRVPHTYKTVWNPGHYNHHGNWVAGHWIEIVHKPGYRSKTRVWRR